MGFFPSFSEWYQAMKKEYIRHDKGMLNTPGSYVMNRRGKGNFLPVKDIPFVVLDSHYKTYIKVLQGNKDTMAILIKNLREGNLKNSYEDVEFRNIGGAMYSQMLDNQVFRSFAPDSSVTSKQKQQAKEARETQARKGSGTKQNITTDTNAQDEEIKKLKAQVSRNQSNYKKKIAKIRIEHANKINLLQSA